MEADGAILGLSALTNPQNIRSSMTQEELAAIEHKITPNSKPQISDQDLDDSVDKILKDIARQVGSESILGDSQRDGDSDSDYDSDDSGSSGMSGTSAATSRSGRSMMSGVSRASSRRSNRGAGYGAGYGGSYGGSGSGSGAGYGAAAPASSFNVPEMREERTLTEKLREKNRQAHLDRVLENMQYHEEGLLDDALVEDQKMNLLIEIDQDWEELVVQRVDMSNIEKPTMSSSLDEITLIHRRLREKIRHIQNADIGESGMMFVVNQITKVCDGSRPYLPDLDGWGPQAKIILRRNRWMLSRGVSKTASQIGMGDLGLAFMQLGVSAAAYSALRTAQNKAANSAEKNRIASRGLLNEIGDMESAGDVSRYA